MADTSELRAKTDEVFKKTAHLDQSLAPIIKSIEKLFDIFNKQFFDSALSKPVLTLLPEGRRKAYGWLSIDKVWEGGFEEKYYEINLCPEYIHRPIDEVCATLLHEMVHLYNKLNEIQDCSRSSQYHNRKFKDAAERHGLIAEKQGKYGYVKTTLKPETLEFIKNLELSKFDLFRRETKYGAETEDVTASETQKPLKPSSTRNYECPQCKLKIRATKDVRVRCDMCNMLFEKQSSSSKERFTFKPRTKKGRKKKSDTKQERRGISYG